MNACQYLSDDVRGARKSAATLASYTPGPREKGISHVYMPICFCMCHLVQAGNLHRYGQRKAVESSFRGPVMSLLTSLSGHLR